MTQIFKEALDYSVSSPSDIFYFICKFNEDAIQNNKPILPATIITSSGNSYHGFPVKKETKGQSNRGLLVQESNFRDTFAMQVIELGNIISIQFDNASLLSAQLSGGKIPPKVPHGVEVPGSLALKRQAANVSEELQGAYQLKLDFTNFEFVKELSNEAALYQVHLFLNALPGVLQKIASDDIGLAALKDLNSIQVTLTQDKAITFKQNGKDLAVNIDFSKALPQDLNGFFVEQMEIALEYEG